VKAAAVSRKLRERHAEILASVPVAHIEAGLRSFNRRMPEEINRVVADHLAYLDMVTLTASARLVLTESGGLQKEAYWLAVPCITLRDETEWVETIDAGWNTLTGADTGRIVDAVLTFVPPDSRPVLDGDGGAAERCVDLLGQLALEGDGHALSA
jgi:UDP-N-acetylglucosamine 2-epimerase